MKNHKQERVHTMMPIELQEVEKKQRRKITLKVAKVGGLAYAGELDMSVQARGLENE